jgi:hypothetical protein
MAYDPVIGKTADCDENNRLTYYQYDNMGRLLFIKDENSNIVKAYEYNSVANPTGCPGAYHNNEITEYFTKSNCGPGYIGGQVPYTVPANKYSSIYSQEDADAQAEAELNANGQLTADQSNNCIQVYYNEEKWQDFESESCGDGYIGGVVRYTVPANRYWSTDPNEANQMALDEINANGQAYANDPDHMSCILDTDPHWVADDNAPTECRVINGQPHLFVLATDINPNSSTYNTSDYQDQGPNSGCPTSFASADMSGTYYPTNCDPGWTAYPTYVSMPAGSYTSYYRQKEANDMAYAAALQIANSRNSCVGPEVHVRLFGGNVAGIQCTLTNLATGQVYNLQNGVSTAISAGFYDIYFNATNTSSTYQFGYCNGSSLSTFPVTKHNVLIKQDCALGVSNYPF